MIKEVKTVIATCDWCHHRSEPYTFCSALAGAMPPRGWSHCTSGGWGPFPHYDRTEDLCPDCTQKAIKEDRGKVRLIP